MEQGTIFSLIARGSAASMSVTFRTRTQASTRSPNPQIMSFYTISSLSQARCDARCIRCLQPGDEDRKDYADPGQVWFWRGSTVQYTHQLMEDAKSSMDNRRTVRRGSREITDLEYSRYTSSSGCSSTQSDSLTPKSGRSPRSVCLPLRSRGQSKKMG